MSDLQIYVTLATFAGVIAVIALGLVDMTVAALVGVGVLVIFGVLRQSDADETFRSASSSVALLFGGMVVARVLAPTGIFDRGGELYLRACRGSGRRFLLLLVLIVAPICAVLPNATTVILLAPVVIRVAQALEVDFVGPMILTAIVSNAAGMLTLVGDPATFLVGSSIGMTFATYLQRVSLAGLLAVLVVIPLLPWLMPHIWHKRMPIVTLPAPTPLNRPAFALAAFSVLLVMVVLFLFGEVLPTQIVPPAVAILGAALALLVVQTMRIESVENVLRDIDWRTLIFLSAIFCLVQALTKAGPLQQLALLLNTWFGQDYLFAALALLAGIGALSTVLANIPVVAAMLITAKGYLVVANAVPETALAAGFTDWPVEVVPVFVAMMFGATLGGNATLIGASANLVAVGACAAHGERISFGRFMRYGVPITLAQLAIGAIYVYLMF